MSESPAASVVLAPIAAVRAYVILRGTLLLLAVDVWMTLLGPAWRYGVAGFAVPHFAWMGALPIVTSAAYVGGIAIVSGLCLLAALSPRPPRALLAAIFALYTWGWSSSMLDSYQHHYLLSWILLSFLVYPLHDATTLFGPPGASRPQGAVPRTHAWGPKLTWIVCAVVYLYTAISKTEPEWRNGDALRNITHGGETIPGVVSFFSELGWAGDDFWSFLGASTIAVQLVCSAGYVVAIARDGAPRAIAQLAAGTLAVLVLLVTAGLFSIAPASSVRALVRISVAAAVLALSVRTLVRPLPDHVGRRIGHVVGTLALGAAVSFHVGAEHMGLQIGWFSYYMILLAVATFAPASWLGAVVAVVTSPSRTFAARTTRLPHPIVLGTAFAFVAGAAGAAAGEADLPGVVVGTALLAAITLGVVLVAWRVDRSAEALAALASLAVFSAVMTVGLRVGLERYDYWRFAGGDFRRRGEPAAALEAYRHALVYAPDEVPEDADEGEREPPRERIGRRIRELEAVVGEREGAE